MKGVITRFAPSPTGHLHLGHAYAALYAYDLAMKNDGVFLLRFEDIDTTRIRKEYYQAIEDDLEDLGIEWSKPVLRQLDRMASYRQSLEKLKMLGVVYPCFCTRREIAVEVANISNAPHGPEGALYPGTCRHLSLDEREEKIAQGVDHCWRFDSERAIAITGKLTFTDGSGNITEVDPNLLGDVILARKDISTSYHLAVVVDDAFQKITDVSRGKDLLASTHVHRILQEILGFTESTYHHHKLILDRNGKRLAKRDESMSIRSYIQSGKSLTNLRNDFFY